MTTREECMKQVGQILSEGIYRVFSTPAEAAAKAAWIPGGPSVAELEAQTREMQSAAREARAA